jgi:hypothetical protein
MSAHARRTRAPQILSLSRPLNEIATEPRHNVRSRGRLNACRIAQAADSQVETAHFAKAIALALVGFHFNATGPDPTARNATSPVFRMAS